MIFAPIRQVILQVCVVFYRCDDNIHNVKNGKNQNKATKVAVAVSKWEGKYNAIKGQKYLEAVKFLNSVEETA